MFVVDSCTDEAVQIKDTESCVYSSVPSEVLYQYMSEFKVPVVGATIVKQNGGKALSLPRLQCLNLPTVGDICVLDITDSLKANTYNGIRLMSFRSRRGESTVLAREIAGYSIEDKQEIINIQGSIGVVYRIRPNLVGGFDRNLDDFSLLIASKKIIGNGDVSEMYMYTYIRNNLRLIGQGIV